MSKKKPDLRLKAKDKGRIAKEGLVILVAVLFIIAYSATSTSAVAA